MTWHFCPSRFLSLAFKSNGRKGVDHISRLFQNQYCFYILLFRCRPFYVVMLLLVLLLILIRTAVLILLCCSNAYHVLSL